MTSTRLVIPALCGIALMGGCGKRLTSANLEAVAGDMSKKQVESILGQPTSITNFEFPLQTQRKILPATRYYYEQDGQTVELHFVDDKLIDVVGSLEPGGKSSNRIAERLNTTSETRHMPAIDEAPVEEVRPPLPEAPENKAD